MIPASFPPAASAASASTRAPGDTVQARAPSDAVPPPSPGGSGPLRAPPGAGLDGGGGPLRWRLLLLRGVTGIVFGLLALLLPGPTLASLVLLFAVYMLIDGVAALVSGARAARHERGRWGWFLFEGLADIAAGLVAFFWPGLTIFVFVWLSAFWALVSGALMLGAALRWTRGQGRGWLVLGGLVSLVWGVLLLMAPVAGALVMTLWLGAYALAFGIALLVLALRLRRDGGTAATTAA